MIGQTKTKPQETLDFNINKQMESFSFHPPKNLWGEGRWLLAATSFQANSFVFNITDGNNTFSNTTPCCWSSQQGTEKIFKLRDIFDVRIRNDSELHVDEVNKKRNQIKIGENKYKLSDLDTIKNDISDELKDVEYKDLENMVFSLGLTKTEILNTLDKNYIDTSTKI